MWENGKRMTDVMEQCVSVQLTERDEAAASRVRRESLTWIPDTSLGPLPPLDLVW